MPNVVRWLLGGVVVVLVLGPPLALYRFEYIHAKRFREVTPGRFYRCGQMTADGLREIVARHGIRTVINLQHENRDPLLRDHWLGKGTITESELCRQLGVRYVLLTPDLLPPDNRPDTEPPVVAEFLELLDDESNYPILLHCKAGLHRTGRLTAIYRMEYQGWSAGEALRELRANGYGYLAASEADVFIIQFVQHYVPRSERPPVLPVAPAPRAVRVKLTSIELEGGGR
jgi:tyrosine-protein phosphatase SIW14